MIPRRTRQREVLEEVLRSAGRPLSVEEILEGGRGQLPRLGIATVYRFVKCEVEAGVLQILELPGMDTRYELSGLRHHHHFRCDRCRRVFDMPGCSNLIDARAPAGFQVRAHEVVLFGLCPDCQG